MANPPRSAAGEVLERAEQPAHRRTGAGDDHGSGHGGGPPEGVGAVRCHDIRMLTRIDHVGLAVRDLDAAIEFYGRTFDLDVVAPGGQRGAGRPRGMLAVGDSGACIQLLAPLCGPPIAKFLDRHGEGVQQVAYGVDDIDATSAELRARGVRLLYDEAKRGTAGSRINFVHPKDAGRRARRAGPGCPADVRSAVHAEPSQERECMSRPARSQRRCSSLSPLLRSGTRCSAAPEPWGRSDRCMVTVGSA